MAQWDTASTTHLSHSETTFVPRFVLFGIGSLPRQFYGGDILMIHVSPGLPLIFFMKFSARWLWTIGDFLPGIWAGRRTLLADSHQRFESAPWR